MGEGVGCCILQRAKTAVFLCQYIHSFIFPEMAGPPKSATVCGCVYNVCCFIATATGRTG